MSIIVPPGKPTVIVRGSPQTVTVGKTVNQGVVVQEPAKMPVQPCDPHPVVVEEPVSKTVKVVTKGPQGEPGPPGPQGPPGPGGINVINDPADGDIPEYNEALGGYVARRDPRKLLIDGGNF